MTQLSFVTAFRNATLTLSRAIESVVYQTVEDWELVLVDDGSTDDGAAVAESWVARDARIRLIRQPAVGVSAARNAGLAEAGGEWVAFLDADDTVRPRFAAALLARGDGHDLVACGFDRVGASGERIVRVGPLDWADDPLAVARAGPPGAINAFIARRESLLAIGGFDSTLRAGEDWDLWLRLVEADVSVGACPRALARYHATPGGLSADGAVLVREFARVRALANTRATDAGEAVPYPDHVAAAQGWGDVFWNAGVAAGRGMDTGALLANPPSLAGLRWGLDAAGLAERWLDGAAVGLGRSRRALIGHWGMLQPRLDGLLATLPSEVPWPAVARALTERLARVAAPAGGRMMGAVWCSALDARALASGLAPPAEAERLVLRVGSLRPARWWSLTLPNWGALSAGEARRLVARGLAQRVGGRADTIAAGPLATAHRLGALAHRVRPTPPFGCWQPVAARTRVTAVQQRVDATLPNIPTAVLPPPDHEHPATGAGRDEWERFFARADPWDYGNAYEAEKYDRTLELIADRPVARALEVACAEGLFTARLAEHVDRLTACDISQTALDRAARRLEGRGVTLEQRDVFADGVIGRFDLVVASEVLYYMADRSALDRFLASARDALEPGGRFVHAHAYQLSDSPGRTGFDWDDPFGAATIHSALLATPGLVHRRSVETPLYRVDEFERADDAHPASVDARWVAQLDDALAGDVVPNGAVTSRADAADERATRVPVLMYHRIATDGPPALAPYRLNPAAFAEQLRFLRRRGVRSVSPDEWQADARHAGRLHGRPVVLTFDDATEDFATTAWPLCRRHGFGAHLFVPVDHVGGRAEWDAHFGEPARLLDWPDLARLVEEGVTIGSHLASHVAAPLLTVDELLEEAVRSRLTLERLTGGPVTTVAPPFGESEGWVDEVLAAAGYHQSFRAHGGPAPVCGGRMALPRIAVDPTISLEVFAELVGLAHEPPDEGDRRGWDG